MTTKTLILSLYGAGALYALWLFYLAVMNLKRARNDGTLTKVAYVMGLPMLILGLALDCLVNLTVMTVLFLELPRETLVTGRLQRHARNGTGWRQKLAIWFAVHTTDAFDPSGPHVLK